METLLFFWLLACTESKVVEEVPLDVSERLTEGEARLGVIHDDRALFSGVSAEGTIGDYKIYNSQVRAGGIPEIQAKALAVPRWLVNSQKVSLNAELKLRI